MWFGTASGLCSLDLSSGAWVNFAGIVPGLGQGGIPDLLVDSTGRLWVATFNEGVGVWDGKSWIQYRISNSDLPSNSVNVIDEISPGEYWISAQFPDRPGGIVSSLIREKIKDFPPYYTGASGSEVVAIAKDASGRVWFGTLTAGIDIYQPSK